jgi:hypothetical protein
MCTLGKTIIKVIMKLLKGYKWLMSSLAKFPYLLQINTSVMSTWICLIYFVSWGIGSVAVPRGKVWEWYCVWPNKNKSLRKNLNETSRCKQRGVSFSLVLIISIFYLTSHSSKVWEVRAQREGVSRQEWSEKTDGSFLAKG